MWQLQAQTYHTRTLKTIPYVQYQYSPSQYCTARHSVCNINKYIYFGTDARFIVIIQFQFRISPPIGTDQVHENTEKRKNECHSVVIPAYLIEFQSILKYSNKMLRFRNILLLQVFNMTTGRWWMLHHGLMEVWRASKEGLNQRTSCKIHHFFSRVPFGPRSVEPSSSQ